MIKILALSISVSVLPLTQKIVSVQNPAPVYAFDFTYAQPYNPFDQKKEDKAPSVDALKKGSWYANALQYIEQSEYQFVWEEKSNTYCTPNRQQNLRFFYNKEGFSVEPRTAKIPLAAYGPTVREKEKKYRYLPNWKINFNLDKKQIGDGNWRVAENKAEYITDNITVQYLNTKEGMRQNFIVQSPLSNNDALSINFQINTKLKTYLHGNQLQFFHGKTNVLNYEGLNVWDANNKVLTASIQKNKKGGYNIKVDAKDAVYPITIDPISSTPNSILDDANQASANFGVSVSSAGDVNGDGYSDVIIGANQYDDGANADEGRAFVYHGAATGISATPNSTLDDADQANANFGTSVATAGDANGDGYSDVIIGANLYDDGANTDEGRAFVYHGSATGLSASPNSLLDDANQASAQFGMSVATAGDVNGDGYSDVIIGANAYDDGANTDEGRAFVYHGSATGLSASPNSLLDDANQASANFGFSVASAGDVNGDGYSDVIIGAYRFDDGANTNEGRAYIYHGSAAGLSALPNSAPDDANQANARFGIAVAGAGDVNGDGYSDVIIGANGFDDAANASEGRAYVYHGSVTGIAAMPSSILDTANQAGAQFGISVTCAGDINGDGYSDVIVGAHLYDNGANTDEGRAFIFQGSSTGLSGGTAAPLGDANQASAQFGVSVASAGDVNGDGYSDVIIGASGFDDGANTDEGRAFVYHGSAAGLSANPTATPGDANQAGANFGISVASAGDVNGDGYSDVIIGAHLYDVGGNTWEGRAFLYHGSATGLPVSPSIILDDANQAGAKFGISVACAGDVNGDGYSDVIIGADSYDDGPNMFEGRAFVHYGSATGISATPDSTPDDANQQEANFGVSVASAGDVNGDGYSDVIIGASFYNGPTTGITNEGAAYIYHGSATGLAASPNIRLLGSQSLSDFGYSVAGAGDVNGDGFSDVIIGADLYDSPSLVDVGRAYVYYGSVTGIPSSAGNIFDCDQTDAYFGYSVAGAGDVNGDGYNDVIVGAYRYNDGAIANEGRAFVYHGSAAGLSATPNSTPDDADQANAHLGYSVASAGDVNGDGYSDVIIGVDAYDEGANTNEGRAFVYHGSATGLSATPNNTPDDANQASAFLGRSVASAGDINGDGYSDLIIGASAYDDGANVAEGRAFLYNGNEFTNNQRNNLRLYNADLTTLLNSSNFNAPNFGVGLYAKSFLGRDKGKLVWETRLNYAAYSGSPITNSTLFTAQQSAYTDLGPNGVELKNLVVKLLGTSKYTKLRARVKYNPATAITGQVYGPWRNVENVINGGSSGVIPMKLIAFNAAWMQKGKTAKLDFVTEHESSICCFDIEKSSDGFHFSTIGSITATNTSRTVTYSFVDAAATANTQYYRLKIKSTDGQIEYSNIQLLKNDKAREILMFPNPTTDVLQLQLNAVYDKMEVQIVNSAGHLVKRLSMAATNPTITIPVKDLAAGNYWLHLQGGDEKQVLQFVKQ